MSEPTSYAEILKRNTTNISNNVKTIDIRDVYVDVLDSDNLTLPEYETYGAAGMDLRANFPNTLESVTVQPGTRALIPTGLFVAIPVGYEIQIRPRSGLALKKGITVLNSPGTIDSDYRGEIKVIIMNHGDEPFLIEHGDRIAQAVLTTVSRIEWRKVITLPESDRGEGGFGHTGKR